MRKVNYKRAQQYILYYLDTYHAFIGPQDGWTDDMKYIIQEINNLQNIKNKE